MARILIADDEPNILRFLRFHLEHDSHEVEEAWNGLEAWRKMRKTAFDLVVIDVMMPEMNGIELVMLMEANTADASLPVVLMGNRSPDSVQDKDMTVPVARSG